MPSTTTDTAPPAATSTNTATQPAPEFTEAIAAELVAVLSAGGTVDLLRRVGATDTSAMTRTTTMIYTGGDGGTSVTMEYRPDAGSFRLLFPADGNGTVEVVLTRPTVAYLTHYTSSQGVNDEGALSTIDATYLQLLLGRLAEKGELSPAQTKELETLITRFKEHGLEGTGEEQLKQLNKLVELLQKVTDKVGVAYAANNLEYIGKMVEAIIDGVKKVKEAEYEKFKNLIGENKTLKQAKEIVDEMKAGFRPGWVEEHWLRWQLEYLKDKLDKAKK